MKMIIAILAKVTFIYLPKICMYVATGWLIILLTIEIMKSHIV